jgi:hypothetical protein
VGAQFETAKGACAPSLNADDSEAGPDTARELPAGAGRIARIGAGSSAVVTSARSGSRPSMLHRRVTFHARLGGARVERPSTETAQVDDQSEEWFASYAEPSNQSSNRHRRVRHRRGHDPRRLRQHRLNVVMMVVSVVFVGAMTACFYAVLTR